MKYTVVTGSQPDEFSVRVNEMLADGWELYGDLVGHSYENLSMNFFAQAMVKREAGEASVQRR